MGARVAPLTVALAEIGRAAEAMGRQLRAAGFIAPAPVRSPAIPVFIAGKPNRCPDCHGEAFTVGRITAECCGCGLPLPIVHSRKVM